MYSDADLKIKDGTLVYAGLSGTPERLRLKYIAPAAVPRVSYDHSVAELLPSALRLHPCEDYEALCPACRVFGWVYQAEQGEKIPVGKATAYAGRLRLSHGTLLEDKGTLDDTTLTILSSPKPTTTRFYLRPRSGKPRDGLSDAKAGYDGDNVLRGRKFYRHHGEADPSEYKRMTTDRFDGKDNQNRTVRGARRSGNRFRFTIDFHNLAPVELGALLWALELREGDQQGYHRLGFAKPLGFGSVKLEVSALELMDPVVRYESSEADSGWQDGLAKKVKWVDSFRKAMETVYGESLDGLTNISDLLALLGGPPDLPIHYPRTGRRPSPEGKNFEWFVGNKRRHGPKIALTLADEDKEGLPLIDRRGNILK
jgi:CRISPR-associated protein (TIGR03986 family)